LEAGLKGFRPDSIVMDAPLVYHICKLLFFLAIEAIILAVGIVAIRALPPSPNVLRLIDPSGHQPYCNFTLFVVRF
jgi:hypothetical protein